MHILPFILIFFIIKKNGCHLKIKAALLLSLFLMI